MTLPLLARTGLALGCCLGLSTADPAPPEDGDPPVSVRYPEGLVHGFLVLTVPDGDTLAWGDLLQTVEDDAVHSRMIFRFPDGSVHDERVTFTQDGAFRLWWYGLRQRGPTFPRRLDATLDLATGKYRVETLDPEEEEQEPEVDEGTLEDLPPDVYSGMIPVIAKNLDSGGAEVHVVAFTPAPMLVELEMRPEEETAVLLGDGSRPVVHYVLDPDLGFLKGILADLTGRSPPDNHLWLATGDAPAFVRFEGPLFVEGPPWRIELTVPRWTGGR